MRERIRARLHDTRPQDPACAHRPGLGDLAETDLRIRPRQVTPAAVLVPLIDNDDGLTLLLTQRAAHLKHHAGQISFPGGRIEQCDDGPLDAALRETQEEIGIGPEHVEVVGFLDNYFTITGYTVTPVVGFVRPGLELTLDASEVDDAFEVPVSHVFDPAHHVRREKSMMGVTVPYYEILWHERRIWGATAAMIVAFHARIMKDNRR